MDVLVLAAFGGMKLGLHLCYFFSVNQSIILSIKCQKSALYQIYQADVFKLFVFSDNRTKQI